MVKTVHKECRAVDVYVPHMTEHSEKDTKCRDVQIGRMAGQVSWPVIAGSIIYFLYDLK